MGFHLRLHELHPALAHVPLGLFPAAFLADVYGAVADRPAARELGRRLMPLTAAGGLLTAIAGLAAQEGVRVREDSHDILVTHRNLNGGLVALLGVLACVRARREKPGAGYLVVSAAALAGLGYTAYLGGELVYRHGIGVAAASGVREDASPTLGPGRFRLAAHIAGENIVHALQHAVRHLRKGSFAPAMRQ